MASSASSTSPHLPPHASLHRQLSSNTSTSTTSSGSSIGLGIYSADDATHSSSPAPSTSSSTSSPRGTPDPSFTLSFSSSSSLGVGLSSSSASTASSSSINTMEFPSPLSSGSTATHPTSPAAAHQHQPSPSSSSSTAATHHPPFTPGPDPHRVLLLLDCQTGMLAQPPIGVPNAEGVRRNIEQVLEEARRARPAPLIVHMRNNGDVGEPDEPGTPGWELVFKPRDEVVDGDVEGEVGVGASESGSGSRGGGGAGNVRPDGSLRELVIDKRKNNAFRGTPLADLVPATAEMVIVGFQTDHSIRATCQEGVKRGNEVLLIRGAHATHDRIEVLYGGGTTPASRIEGEVESELEDLGVHVLDMKDLPGIFMDR